MDSWAPSATPSGTYPFNRCVSLVGGEGFVPASTTGASALALGESGVLTRLGANSLHWHHAYLFEDGRIVLTTSDNYDSYWTAVASGLVCAEGSYQALGYQPWWDMRASVTSVVFDAGMGNLAELNLNYLLYGHTTLASVEGLGNLSGVRRMRYTFNSCSAPAELDFRGFDPSGLTDLFYCFAGCSSLATILADATWALPSSGVDGLQCFYNCPSLVGGAGTAWSSSNTGYQYMRIDGGTASPGYLTAG